MGVRHGRHGPRHREAFQPPPTVAANQAALRSGEAVRAALRSGEAVRAALCFNRGLSLARAPPPRVSSGPMRVVAATLCLALCGCDSVHALFGPRTRRPPTLPEVAMGPW